MSNLVVTVGNDPRRLTLGKSEFVAEGGEGRVYITGGQAFKIYLPGHGIPEGKIRELAVLDHPQILGPRQPVFSYPGRSLAGYVMPACKGGEALAAFIPPGVKDRLGLPRETWVGVVQELRKIFEFVHGKGCLVVDANELNFLLDPTVSASPFAIDVDSYRTPSYPPTAIMEHIRDRHQVAFDEGTDWFSWAVLTLMLLTGVHPYKGKHIKIKGLDARMEADLSILSPEVSVPAVCPAPSSVVPPGLLAWYGAVLGKKRLREPPPADFSGTLTPRAPKQVLAGKGLVVFEPIPDLPELGEILHAEWVRGEWLLVLGRRGVAVRQGDTGQWQKLEQWQGGRLALGTGGERVNVFLREGWLYASVGPKFEVQRTTIGAESLTVCQGQAVVKTGSNLYAVDFHCGGGRLVASAASIAQVMPQATRLFPGCALQNQVGRPVVTIPGEGSFPVDLLRPYRVVSAWYRYGTLAVLGYDVGGAPWSIYHRSGSPVVIEAGSGMVAHAAVLKDGRLVRIVEEGKMVVSRGGKEITVEDPAISTGLSLFSDEQRVFSWRGTQVGRLRLK